ncbi:hypothetical protein JCM19232_5755 [Vibrio ishigakensis]|uniref:Uncharacterized protein n=1 Tax=Vibrio ishigakensis TaxID=1481914 RepID=A0A0B8PF59_9VIBR|nr:hypothetical protein JCM19232_5755 [Vibrio ishigakensis]
MRNSTGANETVFLQLKIDFRSQFAVLFTVSAVIVVEADVETSEIFLVFLLTAAIISSG